MRQRRLLPAINISSERFPLNHRIPCPLPNDNPMMTTTGGDATLFEESFTITNIDQSKYDRVARIYATSTDNQTVISLDVNVELFPCQVSEGINVVLATSLALDGSKDDEKGWRDNKKGVHPETSLAEMFDYVCHGKIYKFEDGEDGQTM